MKFIRRFLKSKKYNTKTILKRTFFLTKKAIENAFSNQVYLSILILFSFSIVSVYFYINFYKDVSDFFQGLFVEFSGMLFDIFVFGVLMAFFLNLNVKKKEIARQQEIISDYKRWVSDEAVYRIAGAIRRLNKQGVFKIDFRGIFLKNFEFKTHDIDNISSSVFYDGAWGEVSSYTNVLLEEVDFNYVNCTDVVFSKLNPFGTMVKWSPVVLKNCSFIGAKLVNAKFNGSSMEWDEPPPESKYEYEEDESGRYSLQSHWSPFEGADLEGADFSQVRFKNADFREAENIEKAIFIYATGLETCAFDDYETQQLILEKSRPRETNIHE